jgi:hypothetical protein
MSITSNLPPFVPQGKLEERPLPLLIAQILNARLSGMLRIAAEGQKPWIYFEDGFPAGVHAPKSSDYLGQVLRELGFIDDAAFNESLMRMAKEKRLQGQILLDMGTLDEKKLERGLSLQIARKISRLFALTSGSYDFFEDDELPLPLEAIPINPFALVYNAIRNNYKPEDLKRGLNPLIGRAVRASRMFVERGGLFEFPPDDLADAKLLEEFRLPQEYVRGVRAGPTSGMMMLIALMYCDMLETEEASFAQPMPGVKASPAPAAPAQPAPAAPDPGAGRAPQVETAARRGARPAQDTQGAGTAVPAALKEKINAKFEQVKTADHYGVLEVPKDADTERIKKSFLTLAKVYHPDRVADSGDEELRHRMDVILSKINEAYQVLSNSSGRAQYELKQAKEQAKPGAGGPGGAQQPRPEEARVQFQKGLVFMKKNDLTAAAEAFRWASELDPKNGDYPAYRHWADLQRSTEPAEVKLLNAKGELATVIKAFPEGFWGYRFMALVCQKMGDVQGYQTHLVKAAKINPKDVECARELRLIHTRKEKEAASRFFGLKLK